jgi:hypothetical protein
MIENILIYYGTWLFPSATCFYIILHEKYKWNRFSAYIVSCLIAGTLMYPIEKYLVFIH